MVTDVEKPKTWGGRRAGAGRPKSGRRVGPAHRKRPELSAKHPVHVSLKLRERHPDLRTRDYYYAIGGGRRTVTFRERYHATQILTARQARNTLAYVLNNWRRHREDCVFLRHFDAPVDAYSSGVTFAGWAGHPQFTLPRGYEPLPMSPPQTELLASSWRRFGLIDPFERPGRPW